MRACIYRGQVKGEMVVPHFGNFLNCFNYIFGDRKSELFKVYKRIDIEFKKANLKDNVALIIIFEFKGHYILSANTHILFNPKRGDIKLAQVMI